MRKVVGVDFRLKTDEIVTTHRRNEVFMIWERRQNLWRWKWDVVKKPDPVAMTTIPNPQDLAGNVKWAKALYWRIRCNSPGSHLRRGPVSTYD